MYTYISALIFVCFDDNKLLNNYGTLLLYCIHKLNIQVNLLKTNAYYISLTGLF